MWGSITGTVGGAAGSAFGNVGLGMKLGARIAIQAGFNAGIAGLLYSIQGIATDSWSPMGFVSSLVFGSLGGAIGVSPTWGQGARSIFVGAGLGLGESTLGEIIDWIQSKRTQRNSHDLVVDFAY